MPSPSANRAAIPITSALTDIVNGTISALFEQSLTPIQQQLDELRELLIGDMPVGKAKEHIAKEREEHSDGDGAQQVERPSSRFEKLVEQTRRIQHRLDHVEATRRDEISLVNDALQTLDDRVQEQDLLHRQLLRENSDAWLGEFSNIDNRLTALERQPQRNLIHHQSHLKLQPTYTPGQVTKMALRAVHRLEKKWLFEVFDEWRATVARTKRTRNLLVKAVLRLEHMQCGRTFLPWLAGAGALQQERQQKLAESAWVESHRAGMEELRSGMHDVREHLGTKIDGVVELHRSELDELRGGMSGLMESHRSGLDELQGKMVDVREQVESQLHEVAVSGTETEEAAQQRRQLQIERMALRAVLRLEKKWLFGVFDEWRVTVARTKRTRNLLVKAVLRLEHMQCGRTFLPWLAGARALQQGQQQLVFNEIETLAGALHQKSMDMDARHAESSATASEQRQLQIERMALRAVLRLEKKWLFGVFDEWRATVARTKRTRNLLVKAVLRLEHMQCGRTFLPWLAGARALQQGQQQLAFNEIETLAGALHQKSMDMDARHAESSATASEQRQLQIERMALRAVLRLEKKWLFGVFDEWRATVARTKRTRNLLVKAVLRLEHMQCGRTFLPWLAGAGALQQERQQKLAESAWMESHRAGMEELRSGMHDVREHLGTKIDGVVELHRSELDELRGGMSGLMESHRSGLDELQGKMVDVREQIWSQIDGEVADRAASLTAEYRDQVAEMQCRMVSESAARIEWTEMHEQYLSDDAAQRRQALIQKSILRMTDRRVHRCCRQSFAHWQGIVADARRLQNLCRKATLRVETAQLARTFLPWLSLALVDITSRQNSAFKLLLLDHHHADRNERATINERHRMQQIERMALRAVLRLEKKWLFGVFDEWRATVARTKRTRNLLVKAVLRLEHMQCGRTFLPWLAGARSLQQGQQQLAFNEIETLAGALHQKSMDMDARHAESSATASEQRQLQIERMALRAVLRLEKKWLFGVFDEWRATVARTKRTRNLLVKAVLRLEHMQCGRTFLPWLAGARALQQERQQKLAESAWMESHRAGMEELRSGMHDVREHLGTKIDGVVELHRSELDELRGGMSGLMESHRSGLDELQGKMVDVREQVESQLHEVAVSGTETEEAAQQRRQLQIERMALRAVLRLEKKWLFGVFDEWRATVARTKRTRNLLVKAVLRLEHMQCGRTFLPWLAGAGALQQERQQKLAESAWMESHRAGMEELRSGMHDVREHLGTKIDGVVELHRSELDELRGGMSGLMESHRSGLDELQGKMVDVREQVESQLHEVAVSGTETEEAAQQRRQLQIERMALRAVLRLEKKWLFGVFDEWRATVARTKRTRNLLVKAVLRLEHMQCGRTFLPWLAGARALQQERQQKLAESAWMESHRAGMEELRSGMHDVREHLGTKIDGVVELHRSELDELRGGMSGLVESHRSGLDELQGKMVDVREQIWSQIDGEVADRAASLTAEYRDQVAEMQCRMVSESAARIEWTEMHEQYLSDDAAQRRQALIQKSILRMTDRRVHRCCRQSFAHWQGIVADARRLQNLCRKATLRVETAQLARTFLPWLSTARIIRATAAASNPGLEEKMDAAALATVVGKLEDIDLQMMDLSEDVGKLEVNLREEIVMVQVRCERITRDRGTPARSERRSLNGSPTPERSLIEASADGSSTPSRSARSKRSTLYIDGRLGVPVDDADAQALVRMRRELAALRTKQAEREEQLRRLRKLRQCSGAGM